MVSLFRGSTVKFSLKAIFATKKVWKDFEVFNNSPCEQYFHHYFAILGPKEDLDMWGIEAVENFQPDGPILTNQDLEK